MLDKINMKNNRKGDYIMLENIGIPTFDETESDALNEMAMLNIMVSSTAKKNKDLFIKWLESINSKRDKPFNSKTVYNYVNKLRIIFRKFPKPIKLESISDFYDINNKDTLDEYVKHLNNNKEYIDYNDRSNNQCSCALKYYAKFLAADVIFTYSRNRIIFGAPGTGKSFLLKTDCEKLLQAGGCYERITLHPDYTYAQFVGCYKPAMSAKDNNIEYRFVPGPFMRVYVEALKQPTKPCILIIEEINRARVAAVFGDIFQLLDRNENGESEYTITTPEDVRDYLVRQMGGAAEAYKTIKLPKNLFIWATMNSADQGVYPMDTAFKRRWSFEYLSIDEGEDNMPLVKLKLGRQNDYETDWNLLRKAINNKLSQELRVNEDKLLGPFYISRYALEAASEEKLTDETAKRFKDTVKDKVLMYLYEDAARQKRSIMFAGCSDYTRYSSICRDFEAKGMEIFGSTFKQDYYNVLVKES